MFGEPIEDLLVELGSLIGQAVAAEVQEGERGEHQRVARQVADAGDGDGGGEFLIVGIGFRGGLLEPLAPLAQEAFDAGGVQVLNAGEGEVLQGSAAFVRAGA